MIDLKSYNWKGIGIVAGVIVIVLLIIWLAVKPSKYENELIDHLKQQNDSLRAENALAREREIQREKKIDSLFTSFKNIDREIIRTKEYHEKVIRIYDTASTYMLEKFFADRYE